MDPDLPAEKVNVSPQPRATRGQARAPEEGRWGWGASGLLMGGGRGLGGWGGLGSADLVPELSTLGSGLLEQRSPNSRI